MDSSAFDIMKNLQDFDLKDKKTYKPEPMLAENHSRFVLFPIQYNDLWQYYKNAEAKFWTAEEIDLHDDLQGYQALEGKTKAHIIQLLSLLCTVDSMYDAAIPSKFSNEIQIPEARCFFGFQIMQQNIHAETVSLLLDMLTVDQEEYRTDTLELVSKLTSVGRKMSWIEKYLTDTDDHFSKRLVAYIVYLGIFQSTIFTLIFHLAGPGNKFMPGLVNTAAKFRHDYDIYLKFYNNLKLHLANVVPESDIRSMIAEAASIEKSLVDDLCELSAGSLSIGRIAVDFDVLKMKIMNSANDLSKLLGCGVLYQGKDPLPWVEQVYNAEIGTHHAGDAKIAASTPVKQRTETLQFSIDEEF
ncbi:Ribonucleotide-diphosphate reductase (RNR), small subunit [Boothiomyces sp. JEL0838]|nr:Ribonucleotide-diphosphate reductase (RNR), small subunit [Boothiomyces sp. JEL0838]